MLEYISEISQQMPIVVAALNQGFMQTLRLFFVTLLGALPLGLVIACGSMSRFWPLRIFTRMFVGVIRGTPLMIQLLVFYYFPGLVLKTNIWGSGEAGRFTAAAIGFISITHVTSRRSTAAASRAFPADRRKPALCWV